MSDLVRITVKLSKDEARALLKLAGDEYRHPREQARKFILDGLRNSEVRKEQNEVVSAA